MNRSELIEAEVKDLVMELLVCGRKEDEDLPRGEIEAAIVAGEISITYIAAVFTKELIAQLCSA